MKSVGLKEMKLLLKVVNYLKNTKDYGLKLIKWNGLNEVHLIFMLKVNMMEIKKRKVYLDG